MFFNYSYFYQIIHVVSCVFDKIGHTLLQIFIRLVKQGLDCDIKLTIWHQFWWCCDNTGIFSRRGGFLTEY